MRTIRFIFTALLSMVAFVACNKDNSATLTLNRTSLYFASWNDAPQTVTYVASNAEKVAVASISDVTISTSTSATP